MFWREANWQICCAGCPAPGRGAKANRPRPRVQLWHGTNDTLVPYSLLRESIEQWTDVFGLSQTPTSTDTPQSGWNRSRYADTSGTVQVEAYSIQGAGHSLRPAAWPRTRSRSSASPHRARPRRRARPHRRPRAEGGAFRRDAQP